MDKIISFKDLIIYKNSYAGSITIMTKLLPKLPPEEKYDLRDQLSRSCKAIPRLIAEGYAKRHQKAGFQKYLDDALGECNEITVSLSHAKDIYSRYVDTKLCEELIILYDICGKQIYRLSESWSRFSKIKHLPQPITATAPQQTPTTNPTPFPHPSQPTT
ncbi:MAG: four helix bundle protein [Candidatus Omnitrophica bacterium]|nr:four helix bundle protein [Candidatus Omnitrophota bacterium]